MKTPVVVGLVVVSVLITVAIEESRIAALRLDVKLAENAAVAPAAGNPAVTPASNDADAGPVRTKNRAELKPTIPANPAEPDQESLAKSMRKMWDNPAGKSMMNQGVKMAVGMMYGDFIDGLDLTKEEADYFKTLLGKEIGGQQELGMRMMSATPEERKELLEDLKKRGEDAEAEIKQFLNDDEDYKAYTDYKERLPERQQLDGIRATMESKGSPLDAQTEAKLVDVMHRARTESKAPDFSGPNAMAELSKGNISETFENSWASQQEALRTETSTILNPTQQEAFQEYQAQMKEMQLMGLKMAEQMMKGNKGGGD